MIPIYIGYDPRESRVLDVARWSAYRRTSTPLQIRPLVLKDLVAQGIMNRPIEVRDGKLWCPISEAPMATEFAISRFAVPFLRQGGWAMFCDCDVLFLQDPVKLLDLVDPSYAIMAVKHQQRESEAVKMDGQTQTFYRRKNWSSVVLWNLDHPANKRLTNEMLNTLPGRDLHAFKWLEDHEIGELPLAWNYLVGASASELNPADVSLAHYTLGGPWFAGWSGATQWDELWSREEKILRAYEEHAVQIPG
ncbi:hypothetical protein EN817_25075 [Mesorhizobium sp. M3A.F.Ca.ET.174.01.1.1]|nr:hypothetical protein EN844_26085 [Mesorhizobium sp. M3A.F.Ca.ET.201.01.1.1]TGS82721.1 hypothetical protein EN818_25125 [Mesorhizobium sp. M3A.F.Ca.ET.175.01.1.1]TGT22676.1 hypothetical protein EN817_25075 [Mesorhizobium sp. M3A.F.Ca.ET.174.01.1.1]